MVARQRPLYIEMIGPSGVGKTTVLRLVAQDFEGRPLFFRGGLKKRLLQNFCNTARRWQRLRCFLEFYTYLRKKKCASRRLSFRRAVAITGIPGCTSFVAVGNGVMLIEEGPVSYLCSCGGWGLGWEKWVDVLLPDTRSVSIFIVLSATPEELALRSNLRARSPQRRTCRTGKEGIGVEARAPAYEYWTRHLSKAGAHCLHISTSSRSPEDIARKVVQYIRSIDMAPRNNAEVEVATPRLAVDFRSLPPALPAETSHQQRQPG